MTKHRETMKAVYLEIEELTNSLVKAVSLRHNCSHHDMTIASLSCLLMQFHTKRDQYSATMDSLGVELF